MASETAVVVTSQQGRANQHEDLNDDAGTFLYTSIFNHLSYVPTFNHSCLNYLSELTIMDWDWLNGTKIQFCLVPPKREGDRLALNL